jgi:hypothetical protein
VCPWSPSPVLCDLYLRQGRALVKKGEGMCTDQWVEYQLPGTPALPVFPAAFSKVLGIVIDKFIPGSLCFAPRPDSKDGVT